MTDTARGTTDLLSMVWGRGRLWPLLTGERGHYALAAGHDVKPYLYSMEKFASATAHLPGAGVGHGRYSGSSHALGAFHRISEAPCLGPLGIHQITSIGERWGRL